MCIGLSIRIGRIYKQAEHCRLGYRIVQQSQLFREQLVSKIGEARDISSWPIEARDQTFVDRVLANREHYRNGRGLRLNCQDGRGTDRKNHVYRTANQFNRQGGKAIELTIRPTIFDRYVVAFNEAGFFQALAESTDLQLIGICRPGVEKPDHSHRRLLRARRERPPAAAAPSVAKNFRRLMWLAM